MKVPNSGANSPPSVTKKDLIKNQEKINISNKIYDDEFVLLINSLNESIKEYYKVSKNNIIEANTFLSYYQKQGQEIQSLIDEIKNSNSYQRIDKIVEQIPKIDEIMEQLNLNTKSNDNNLNLFFEDAKILFKKMKMKRHQNLLELNNYNNYSNNNKIIRYNPGLNDSFANSFNVSQSRAIAKNNLINNNKKIPSPFTKTNPNTNNINQNASILISINNIYSQIMKLINSFGEFNYMISKTNFEASNKYNNLQQNIKKELDILMNIIQNYFLTNNNKMLNSIKSFNNINNEQNLGNKRSQSTPRGVNREIEKLKKINQINEKKIIDLNNQLNIYKNNINNITELSGLNSESDSKTRQLEMQNNKLKLK